MKSVVKNLGIILATFIFILGFSGIDAKAETFGDYEYQLINEDTEVEITQYNGTDEVVVVPEKIDGKSVTSIGEGAFLDKGIKEVVLNEGITSLGKHAFRRCNNLEKVTIPSSLTEAGNESNPSFDGDSKLKVVVWGDGITAIPDYLFRNTGLEQITIPDSVGLIGKGAFMGCTQLSEISYGEGLQRIQGYAFFNTAITEAVIPEGVVTIGDKAFAKCASLKKAVIPTTIMSAGSKSNLVFEDDDNLTDVTFSEGIFYIPNYICAGLNIKTVVIPDSVTEIGSGSFENCVDLVNVSFGSNIQVISNNAFNLCNLRYIELPDSVTTLGKDSFGNCENLDRVVLSDSISDFDLVLNAFGDLYNDVDFYSYKNNKIRLISVLSEKVITPINNVREDDSFLENKGNNYTVKVYNDYIEHSVHFMTKRENGGQIVISIPSSQKILYDKVYLDGEEVGDAVIKNGLIIIPVDKSSGVVTFYSNKATDSAFFSAVYLKVMTDPSLIRRPLTSLFAPSVELIDCYVLNNKSLDMSLDYDSTGNKVRIKCVAPQGSRLIIKNETKNTEVISSDTNKIGNLNYECNAEGLTEDKYWIFSVMYEGDESSKIYRGISVRDINSVVIESFSVSYNYHNHIITKDLMSGKKVVAARIPNTDLEFKVKVKDNSNVKNAFVVGSDGTDSEYLKCEYNEEEKEYTAVGSFNNIVVQTVSFVINYDNYSNIYDNAEIEINKNVEIIEKQFPNMETEYSCTEDSLHYDLYLEGKENPKEKISYDIDKVNSESVNSAEKLEKYFKEKGYNVDKDLTYDEVTNGQYKYCVIKAKSGNNSTMLCKKLNNNSGSSTHWGRGYTSNSSNMGGVNFFSDIIRQGWNSLSAGEQWIVSHTIGFDGEEFADLIDKVNRSLSMNDPESAFFFIAEYIIMDMLIDGLTDDLPFGPVIGDALNSLYDLIKSLIANHDDIGTAIKSWLQEIFDPSGYVYEAVDTNYVLGAEAAVYYRESEGSEEVVWDAEDYEQINPQITDDAGVFHWDVPIGQYQVRVTKDGYEEARTEWLQVLPPRMGIKIPLVSKSAPKVTDVFADETGMSIFFDKYLKADTISESSVTLKDENGNVIKGVKALAGEKETQDEVEYTKDLVLVVDLSDYSGQKLTIEIDDAVKSYSGVSIAKDEISVTMDGEKKITPTPTPDAGNDDPTPAPEAGNDNPTPTPTDKVPEPTKEPATEDINPTKTPDVNPSNPGADAPATPTIVPTAAPTQAPEKAKPAASGTVLSDGTNKCKYKVVTSDEANPTVDYMGPDDKKLKSVTIPDDVTIDGVTYKVTGIGENALKGMKKLKSVTVGANVISIGDDAFNGCKALTGVTFKGDAVNSIGTKAFSGCKKLKKIVIPKGVKKIGAKAFYGCKKLTKITVKTGVLKSVGKKAFSGVPKADVKTPSKKVNAYRKLMIKAGINRKTKFHK